MHMPRSVRWLFFWALWVALAAVCLQVFFVLRIALWVVIDPSSTTFQRSELWRLQGTPDAPIWRHQWVAYSEISPHIQRAVIASEDARFTQHGGVDWAALESAWQRNTHRPGQVLGGSTISQQLAKNLFLSGERTLLRKGQELLLTLLLEAFLDKQRLLEIYLNHVEWGHGVFGIEAAAQHYYRKTAVTLTARESARLAVMLPSPKRYESVPQSRYLASRATTILSRMPAVELPTAPPALVSP